MQHGTTLWSENNNIVFSLHTLFPIKSSPLAHLSSMSCFFPPQHTCVCVCLSLKDTWCVFWPKYLCQPLSFCTHKGTGSQRGSSHPFFFSQLPTQPAAPSSHLSSPPIFPHGRMGWQEVRGEEGGGVVVDPHVSHNHHFPLMQAPPFLFIYSQLCHDINDALILRGDLPSLFLAPFPQKARINPRHKRPASHWCVWERFCFLDSHGFYHSTVAGCADSFFLLLLSSFPWWYLHRALHIYSPCSSIYVYTVFQVMFSAIRFLWMEVIMAHTRMTKSLSRGQALIMYIFVAFRHFAAINA